MLSRGEKGAVSDPNRREVEHGPEMKCEPRAPRVIPPGGVDQQNGGTIGGRGDRGLQQRSLPECQQTRLVRGSGYPVDRDGRDDARAER